MLVLTDWFPPGFRAGGPIQSTANAVAALCDDFDVSVVTSDRDLGAVGPYPGVPGGEWVPYATAARVMYLPPERRSFAAIGRLLAEVQPDCLYLNSMFSRSFTIYPLAHVWRGTTAARCVLAPRGMLHANALAFKPVKKQLFLACVSASAVTRRIHVHATSPVEKADAMRRLGVDGSRVHVLSNFPARPATAVQPVAKQAGDIRLAFVARIAANKNLLFLIEALRGLEPDITAHLTVVGPIEDAVYWEACQRAIATLPPRIRVEAAGPLPHDEVRTILERSHCLALPTMSENFGHVIIESLGAGRPVIISDQTPWRGLEAAGVGWDLPLDSPGRFTAAIEQMARMDQDTFDRMAMRAWEYAKQATATAELKAGYVRMLMGEQTPAG